MAGAHELPEEKQDTIWDYVLSSDQLDRWLLEGACEYIDIGENCLLKVKVPNSAEYTENDRVSQKITE